jgi:hypothetical protein
MLAKGNVPLVYICDRELVTEAFGMRSRGITYAPTEVIGIFFWPRCTPGLISISKSWIDLRCANANVRTLCWTTLMSSMVCWGTFAIIDSMSSFDSLNDEGDHLSNFSEYVRTAASPWVRISSMTPLTMPGTSTLGADMMPAAELVCLRKTTILGQKSEI